MKPALASPYEERYVKYPCIVQPKLNGIRAVWRNDAFYTRKNERWFDATVKHIADKLKSCISHDIWLDGEFYRHGWTLQNINSAIGVIRQTPIESTKYVTYVVYDMPGNILTYAQRRQIICQLFPLYNFKSADDIHVNIASIPSFICNNKNEADTYYRQFRDAGFEGLMYRVGNCPYNNPARKDNRSKWLLKRKDTMDEEFDVVGALEGNVEGRYEGTLGALVCKTRDGKTFNVGSGFSDDERNNYWSVQPSRIKVEFEMYSPDGIPLKPVYIETVPVNIEGLI